MAAASAGCYQGRDVSILDVYDVQAQADVGVVTQQEAEAIRRVACPGPGGCGIAASFNTWGLAMEAIGLMPRKAVRLQPRTQPKKSSAIKPASLCAACLNCSCVPEISSQRQAFENAATTIAAVGGSTNGILPIGAGRRSESQFLTARYAGYLPSDASSMQLCTPRYAHDGGPPSHRRHVGTHQTPYQRRPTQWRCDDNDRLHVGRECIESSEAPRGTLLIAPSSMPFKPFADMQICFGNLAPDGMVFKVSSLSEPPFSRPSDLFHVWQRSC